MTWNRRRTIRRSVTFDRWEGFSSPEMVKGWDAPPWKALGAWLLVSGSTRPGRQGRGDPGRMEPGPQAHRRGRVGGPIGVPGGEARLAVSGLRRQRRIAPTRGGRSRLYPRARSDIGPRTGGRSSAAEREHESGQSRLGSWDPRMLLQCQGHRAVPNGLRSIPDVRAQFPIDPSE